VTAVALVLASVALVLSLAGLASSIRELRATKRRTAGGRCGCKKCRRVLGGAA
jgi:hypothetical protein